MSQDTNKPSLPSTLYTEDYFLNACEGYEELVESQGERLSRRLSEAFAYAEVKPGMKVLDVGCGRGEILRHVTRLGARAYGVDYAEVEVNLSREATRDEPAPIGVYRTDAKRLPYPGGTYPRRWPNQELSRLDWTKINSMTFEPVDYDRFPCLRLAVDAGKSGGTCPAVLCAADEVAVELFLSHRIRFTDIAEIVQETLELHRSIGGPSLEDILAPDNWAREYATHISPGRSQKSERSPLESPSIECSSSAFSTMTFSGGSDANRGRKERASIWQKSRGVSFSKR